MGRAELRAHSSVLRSVLATASQGIGAFLHGDDHEGLASGIDTALTLSLGATVRTLAIQAGDNAVGEAVAGNPNPAEDGRGFVRDGSPDSGAHEHAASPPAAHEINVQGGGLDIADGDMTPSLLDGTNFDCAAVFFV